MTSNPAVSAAVSLASRQLPEVMVARHMDLPVFGVSVITDMCIPETLEKAELSKILAAAYKAEPNMTLIMKELLKSLP